MKEELLIHKMNDAGATLIQTEHPGALIFESGFTGHRPEYIRHLMRFIQQHSRLHGKYFFVLNEKIKKDLKGLDGSEDYDIRFFSFPGKYKNNLQRSFAEWKIISEKVLPATPIDEIIFMDIDPYLVLTGTTTFKKHGLKTKGILFQPHVHFLNSSSFTLKGLTQLVKTYFFQKIATFSNKKITGLFVLNDKKAIAAMNKNAKAVYFFLPDPIDREEPDLPDKQDVLDKFHFDKAQKQLLIFGGIDKRKNLINIINAIAQLPENLKSQLHLVIAGKFDAAVKNEYIAAIKKHQKNFGIYFNDGFVSNGEREILFSNSDLILMPYLNFFGSSGVLGHAIKHNKRVIVSNKGIVAAIAAEYGAGIAVNPGKSAEIKEAIQKMLFSPQHTSYDNRRFITEHSPLKFSSTLLNVQV